MRTYIDSEILIWHLRGQRKAVNFFSNLSGEGERRFRISSKTYTAAPGRCDPNTTASTSITFVSRGVETDPSVNSLTSLVFHLAPRAPLPLWTSASQNTSSMTDDCIRSEIQSRPGVDGAVGLHSARHAGALIGRGIAHIERVLTRQNTARNAMLFSLLALPPVSFLYLALRPNPRQLWAQRWPTIVSSGLYQMALDRCVEITGLEYLPETGPVILAGNHINKTSMDGMLLGLKILVERGVPAKWVSIADPPGWMLQHFVRLLGKTDGVILPIQKGMTTKTMGEFLRNPSAFQRRQPILGIFPVGEADFDFEKHMTKPWHTSAAVAALETGAAIVPFFIEGLPYHWGPPDMLKAVARALVGEPPFKFKIRLGPPLQAGGAKEDRNYKEIIERVRRTVRMLAS